MSKRYTIEAQVEIEPKTAALTKALDAWIEGSASEEDVALVVTMFRATVDEQGAIMVSEN